MCRRREKEDLPPFPAVIQTFMMESVCRGKEEGHLKMFPAATQSFCPESVCRRGVGCGTRGV